MAFYELLGEGDDGACLGAVEAEGLNVGFDLFGTCGGERGGVRVACEECTGDGVDAHVGGLCREHGGDEQLEGVVEVEFCDGVGVGFAEDAVDFAGAAHGGEVAFGCTCVEAACGGCGFEFGDESNLQERFGVLCRGVLSHAVFCRGVLYFGAVGVLGHSARVPGLGVWAVARFTVLGPLLIIFCTALFSVSHHFLGSSRRLTLSGRRLCHTGFMSDTIFVLNGPNLNLLGQRRPEVYGYTTLHDIERMVRERAADHGFDVEFMQSNHEGALVDEIQRARTRGAAIIINPAAYTHTSVALHDALEAAELPVVEVHLSNVHRREQFRHHSFVSPQATAVIAGAGAYGYVMAVDFLAQHLAE